MIGFLHTLLRRYVHGSNLLRLPAGNCRILLLNEL
jgi:hypothetical protein